MKRSGPWNEVEELSSDSDSVSDEGFQMASSKRRNKDGNAASTKDIASESVLNRRAQIYQEHMKGIPLPTDHQAVIPCVTWQGLAKSIKRIYGQPLHYLTNVLMKQWDLARMETDDYHWPLEYIIHPCKAAATIWAIEEVHRLTCSHEHLANLWAADPMHSAFLDPVSNAQTT